MLTIKSISGTLLSYVILLLLSQTAMAIPGVQSINDVQNEALLHELMSMSVMNYSAVQPPLTATTLQNAQQAQQILNALIKNFRETGELRNIITLAPGIIELLPDNSDISYLYAIALAAKGDIISAQQVIKQQKDKSIATIYALTAQATIARISGKLDQASAAANKAISLDAKHPYPYNLLGQIYIAQQDYAKALISFQSAVSVAPKFSAGWSNLGSTQLLQGDSGAAEASFSSAISLSPNYCAPRIGRATLLRNSGFIESAIVELETCITTEPELPQANKQLAMLYLQVGRLDDAKKTAQTLIKRDTVFAKTVLADIYLRQTQPHNARKQLLAINTPDAQTHYLLAFCYMLEEQHNKADKHLKQAKKLQPESATLQITRLVFNFYNKQPVDQKAIKALSTDETIGKLVLFVAGNVQASSGNMKEAYRLWNEAEGLLPGFTLNGVPLKVVSKSVTADEQRFLAIGMLYYMKNFHPDSLAAFNKALSANPNSFLANYFAAVTHAHVNNKTEMVKHLRRSLDNAPAFFPANYMLANAYLQSGDIDSAIKYYQKATDSRAEGGVLIKLGLLYEQKNKNKKAAATYRKFIKHYADNFIGYNQLAWLYARNGEQLSEALKLAKKADELQPGNASINDTLGWIYFQKNEYMKAKKHLNLANTISKGNNPDILFHLASLEYALGKTVSAKELVEKALNTSTNFESILQARELLARLQNK